MPKLAEQVWAPLKPDDPDHVHDCGCITYCHYIITMKSRSFPQILYRHACPSHKAYADRLGILNEHT